VVLAPLASLCAVVASSFAKLKPLLLVQPKVCKEVARTYVKFPLFSLPKQLVNYIGGNMPIFLLSPFFDLKYVGYFGMALTLSFVPLSLITRSFYQVLFAHVTQLVNQNKSIWKAYRGYLLVAVCVIAIGFTGLALVLPDLTGWLLGHDKWRMVGIYIQLMLPWLAIITLTNTFDFIFDIFGKQDKQFYVELALFVLRALALLWGIYLNDVWFAVMAFSYVSFLVRLLYAAYQYYLIHQYEKQRCNFI
jgi:O-antigen/teichoic acid export membrane protein